MDGIKPIIYLVHKVRNHLQLKVPLLKIKADNFHNAFLGACLELSFSLFFCWWKEIKASSLMAYLSPISDKEEEDTVPCREKILGWPE